MVSRIFNSPRAAGGGSDGRSRLLALTTCRRAPSEVPMGIRIHLWAEHKATDLLRHLKRSPHEVFGQPYAGYLIFMATEFDREVVDWLRDNVVALDSLTGDDVAFAI